VQYLENRNFAARLTEHLGPHSRLIDAASGRLVDSADLRRLIPAYGAALLSAGLTRGDRVLIGCTLSIPSVLAYLGAIYAGLVAVPVDERVLASRAGALAKATGAKAAWSETGSIPKDASISLLQGDFSGKNASLISPFQCAAADLATLMATSGSTGKPRFVMVSHQNLMANTEAIIQSQHLGANECAMMILPLNYCFGASVLHSHLFAGGSIVLDRRFMFPDKVLQSLVDFDCTTFAGVPTVYNVLLSRSRLRQMAFPSLRRCLQAGGPLAPEKIDEMRSTLPNTEFYVMYGQTEATARISCLDPSSWELKYGSVGRAMNNLAVSIVDEEGNELGAGEVGELCISGPSVCSGYWEDPEETYRVFREDRLHTGDLGHKDRDGYLWIDGRKSAFVKIRGTRVSLAEVEQRVAAMDGVYECGACGVAHPESGDALVLFVVPQPGVQIDVGRIRRDLPASWALESISLVSALPKTSSGKLARTELLHGTTNSYASAG
jgi:acyl-CoA synthetase (AMP-forming)/AMP-acid ligase II